MNFGIRGSRSRVQVGRWIWSITGTHFAKTYGFTIWPQPYNLEHAPALEGIQLNAFLDMQAIDDPHDFAPKFRDRIRATFDPFAHFLHVSRSWRDAGSAHIGGAGERLDRFDIKNEGLRAFLAGVWTLGGPRFRHSLDVYSGLDDNRDLEAYYFLLRIRAFIHLRRGTLSRPRVDGSHAEDVLGFEDFESFGELLGPKIAERERFEFANQVRARLLAARRRVERFARGVIGRELQHGHRTYLGSSIIHGVGGLRHAAPETNATHQDRSSAALSLVNNAVRWFNTRELYTKALARFLPDITPNAARTLSAAGYGARECEIHGDFGHDYFDGLYVRHTNHFASHLLRLVRNEDTAPKVDLVRDGDATLLGVGALDFRGLAACIAGALRHVSA